MVDVNMYEQRVWINFDGDYCGNEFQKLYHLLEGEEVQFDTIAQRHLKVYGQVIDYELLSKPVRSMVDAVDCLVKEMNHVLAQEMPMSEKMGGLKPYAEAMVYVMDIEHMLEGYVDFFDSVAELYDSLHAEKAIGR